MHTMIIDVHGKSEPEKDKVRGRIKDASGMIFQAGPEFLKKMEVGLKYDISYTDESFKRKDGTEVKYRVINEASLTDQGSMTSVVPAAKPSLPNPVPAYSDTKTEDISVLAIMKSQQIKGGDREAIFHCLKQSALAWRDFKKWQKTLASDMDDEIPYDK